MDLAEDYLRAWVAAPTRQTIVDFVAALTDIDLRHPRPSSRRPSRYSVADELGCDDQAQDGHDDGVVLAIQSFSLASGSCERSPRTK